MNLNEGKRKTPVKFYQDKYGTVIYDSVFIQGTAPTLKDAFDEFTRKDFIRDLYYYYDDVVDAKIGHFVPPLEDKEYKGMKYLGMLEIEIETDSIFKDSKKSLNYLSQHKNEIPAHLKWIKDMKQQELALVEMFEPEKTTQDLICKHCGMKIPQGNYYERYRGNAYHLECIWDKLINNHEQAIYKDAQEFFLSLQKYIGNWPAYGFDIEPDYLDDLYLYKHNQRINNEV